MTLPLLHLANILYLVSYSVRDILWLRILTVIAMLLLGCHYMATDQMAPLCWQSAFLAINFFHIGLLVHERRPIELTEEEKLLHETALRPLTIHQVRKLMPRLQWRDAESGEVVLQEGVPNDGLRVIVAGTASVMVAGRAIAQLERGQFFGEMSFLTRGTTSAAVIAAQRVRYALLSESALQDVTIKDRDLAMALQAAIGVDLVHKLLRERKPVA